LLPSSARVATVVATHLRELRLGLKRGTVADQGLDDLGTLLEKADKGGEQRVG